MTEEQYCELKTQIKVLEERMNTNQAKYESAIDRMEANIANREIAKTRWAVGMSIGMVVLVLGAIGLYAKFLFA